MTTEQLEGHQGGTFLRSHGQSKEKDHTEYSTRCFVMGIRLPLSDNFANLATPHFVVLRHRVYSGHGVEYFHVLKCI